MLQTHITLLNEQASRCFSLAKGTQKPKEVLAFLERGQKLLAEARQILKESQEQSTLWYFEFMLHIKREFSFESYIEFNARNNLKPLAESDFNILKNELQSQKVAEY